MKNTVRRKLAPNMQVYETTTLDVVERPTPAAPPVVLRPLKQAMDTMMRPKVHDFTMFEVTSNQVI